MRASRGEISDLLRGLGGLLLAAGAVVLLVRKSGPQGWSELARLLVVLVPAVVLYGLALGPATRADSEHASPGGSILMVAAILLGPLALLELLAWVGASTRRPLNDAGVFAVTALLAGYGARRARVPYAALLAALALLVSWLLVWSKVLDHPSANAYRWLLVAGGALLLIAAAGLARRRAIGAAEVATAGGLAAVAAGVIGVIVGSVIGVVRAIKPVAAGSGTPRSSLLVRPQHLAQPRHPAELVRVHASGLQHFGWDLYLLVVSLALVWLGSRGRVRGLAYVGGIGLVAFAVSVGAQITRLGSGQAPTGSVVGWPLALLLIGVAGLAAPALSRRRPSGRVERSSD
ncbi:MAG: hypothetical protein E6G62_09380 [Actinobacteria bacterium]|nr:MAG: hypothetical protein E6G62_09380 [Actinomycetota bacterium]